MAESDRPRSPFAAMVDLSAQKPVRVLSAGEIKQKLASHQLYLKTEYHEGHRADFSSADLTRFDFAGLDLRGIKMDRALLRGANFIGADLRAANLIGATLQRARLDRSDLSGARLSGANLVSASFENACLAKAEMEFALMAKAVLRGACLCEADMSGAQLDRAVLTRADLRKANLRGAGLREVLLDEADLREARLVIYRVSLAEIERWPRGSQFSRPSGLPPLISVCDAQHFSQIYIKHSLKKRTIGCVCDARDDAIRTLSVKYSSTTQFLSTVLVKVGHHSDAQSFRDAILVCRSRNCTYSHVHFRDC